MNKKILVPVAQGFEEIELVSVVDILRRAGVEVVLCALTPQLLVKGAHGIELKAECELANADTSMLDGIALAGGFDGMMNLKADTRILGLLRELKAAKRLVAAICASPIVLDAAGILQGKFTCYPSCEVGLGGVFVKKAVVSNELVTSAGPATAPLFALEIVRALLGDSVREKIANELLLDTLKQGLD